MSELTVDLTDLTDLTCPTGPAGPSAPATGSATRLTVADTAPVPVPSAPGPDDDPDPDTPADDDGDWGDWAEELPAAQINADLGEDTGDAAWDGDGPGGLLGDDRGMSTIEYALGCVAAAALGALLYLVVTSDTVEAALTGIFERALETK